MATRAVSRQHLPVLTGDGTDGFPSEADFADQMEEYLAALNPKKRAKALMSREMYATILAVLLDPHSTAHSTAQFRFWAKRMFRLVVTPTANLVAHENRPVAVKDQIYAILVGTHGDVNHGGRDKTSAQVRRFYSWLPKELVSRFVKMCPTCIAKRRQQQPYLSDAYLPANLNLIPRRVRVNVARDDESDEEGSPPHYEASGSGQRRFSQPQSAPLPSEGPSAGAGSYVYVGGDERYETQQDTAPYQIDSAGVDGLQPFVGSVEGEGSDAANAYQFYHDHSLAEYSAELPQPPQGGEYALPPADPAQPGQEYYEDEHGAGNLYQPQYSPAYDPHTAYQSWELPAVSGDFYGQAATADGGDGDGYAAIQAFEASQLPLAAPHSVPSVVVEPAAHVPPEWDDSLLAGHAVPSASSTLPLVLPSYETTSSHPPSSPSTSRRARPPPLDLGRSSNLYPSTSEPLYRRASTTSVPLHHHLSPTSYPSSSSADYLSAPRSAPLQRARASYGQYRELQMSPGLASACSTASTDFSSAGSLPLTPGTSASSVDSAGMCPSDAAWLSSDEAIRLLLDSTSLDLSEAESHLAGAEGLQPMALDGVGQQVAPAFSQPTGLEGVDLGFDLFDLLQQPIVEQQQQPPPHVFVPTQAAPQPFRRASERSRLRTASSTYGSTGTGTAASTPTKGRGERRVVSSASAGGHVLTRTPTKEALRFTPY
ncbi:hypothetical protein JCM6882_004354 [Rhodosporidiobolus microsporus]